MQKDKTIIMVLVALVVGFGMGIAIDLLSNKGDKYSQQNTMNMNHVMQGMNHGISGKTGDAFDQAFLFEMIVHHQGAVEMAKQALVNAKHQEIKDLATAIIAAQNKEIADMQAWEKTWYNR